MRLPDEASGDPTHAGRFDGVAHSLHAEIEFNRKLVESLDDCIKILDLDGRVVSLNPGGAKLLGITDVDAFLGTSWFDLWDGEGRVAARTSVATALAGGTGRFSGVCGIAGEERCFQVVVTAMLDAQQRPERLLAVSRDITFERQSIAALAESEADHRRVDETREKFVALAENSSDFIAIFDVAGDTTYINPAGRGLLQIDSSEAARLSYLQYHPASDREVVECELMPALLREGRWNGNLYYRNFRTNALVPVSMNAFALVGRTGALAAFATVSRDRSLRVRIDAGLQLLSRTGSVMFDSLDFEATLRNIAQAFVPEYASYCIIDTVDDARPWSRTVVHRDPSMESIIRELPRPVSTHPLALALEKGVSSCVTVDEAYLAAIGRESERSKATLRLRVKTFVTVPVVTSAGRIAGSLTCARDIEHARGAFETVDVPFVQETGRRAGAALANAQLYERQRRVAVELQAASLPSVLPQTPGVRISADYRPASDEAMIGGDWYDAFVLQDGRIAITVGDVVGHGLGAAIKMTKLRQSMQAAAMIDPEPLAMLTVADKTMRLIDPDSFATAVAAVYDGSTRSLRFASAGHPNPIVSDSLGIVLDSLGAGPMLGLRTGSETGACDVPVPPGATLVFFTDGLVELSRDLEAGHARLHDALRRTDFIRESEPARALVTAVLGNDTGKDDIAVLVVQISGVLESDASGSHRF